MGTASTKTVELEKAREQLKAALADEGGVDFLCPSQEDEFIDAALEKWGAACANEALERVRKVSAKWDGLADAIDDGSGVTDCAITAARLRAMAKQIDEACAP